MALKGGRVASESPGHNPSAPGIRASSLERQLFCSHCANVIDEKAIQITRRSREHKSKTTYFCGGCWELIAGEEYLPKNTIHTGTPWPYYCAICDDKVHHNERSSVVILITTHVGVTGSLICHDDCFLEEAGDHFWD